MPEQGPAGGACPPTCRREDGPRRLVPQDFDRFTASAPARAGASKAFLPSADAASSPWGAGELFPLPLLESEESARFGLSRGCQQRVQKRRKTAKAVNESLSALNWLAGAHAPASDASPTASQFEAVADVAFGHSLYSDTVEIAPGEAARTLLRGGVG